MDKAFSVSAYMPLFITVAEIQERKVSKWSKIRLFWPTLWKPLGQPGWLNATMCARVCAVDTRPHLTTLRKTETVDGCCSRPFLLPRCSRRNPQNCYYVTQFLAHPVEPRERWVHTHATVGKGRDKAFFRMLLICLYF